MEVRCRVRCPVCKRFLSSTDDPAARESLVCDNPECPVGDRPSDWLPELE